MFSVSPKEKMLFAEHLSLLLKGGTSLPESMEVLEEEAKSQGLKKALGDVLKKISEGETLSRSLGQHPKIFDSFFQNVVKIGEKSGTLEENLNYLSSYIRSRYSLRRKIKGALMYPALIVSLALIIVSLITVFVLPRIVNLLETIQVELPLATKILIGSGTFLRDYWFWVLLGFLLFFLIFKLLQRIKLVRFYWDKFTLSLPFFGEINKNLNLARFSRTFYTLFKSGTSILEALDICIDTLSNEVFKSKLRLIRIKVERGEKLSDGLKEYPGVFPLVFSQMIVVGERTGALEDSLLYLTEFYEGEVDSAVKNLSGLLEPILLIFVGVLVAFIALSIITPIYKLIGNLQNLR